MPNMLYALSEDDRPSPKDYEGDGLFAKRNILMLMLTEQCPFYHIHTQETTLHNLSTDTPQHRYWSSRSMSCSESGVQKYVQMHI